MSQNSVFYWHPTHLLRNIFKNHDMNLPILPSKLNIPETNLTIAEFKKSDNDPGNIKNKYLQAKHKVELTLTLWNFFPLKINTQIIEYAITSYFNDALMIFYTYANFAWTTWFLLGRGTRQQIMIGKSSRRAGSSTYLWCCTL